MKRTLSLPLAALLLAPPVFADEGGVGFWLPGNFGSLAALPSDPGWSVPLTGYYAKATTSASTSLPRGGRLTAGMDATSALLFVTPTYTFADPVAGGQAAISLSAAFGRAKVGIDATLSGPGGGAISGSDSDARNGVSDLFPMGSLRWSQGVNHYMAYATAGIPTGTYDKDRLANIGINHWAVDAGGGYTFFDEKNEFSAVLGFTYNFENPDTDYRNGVNAHLDWGASHFVSPEFHVGLVGYFYRQLTGDSGAGATQGDYKSNVSGIGPQAGWFLQNKWYVNLKGYHEFAEQNRTAGWNLWLSVTIPIPQAK